MHHQRSSSAGLAVRALLVFASTSLQAASTYYSYIPATVTSTPANYITTLTTFENDMIPPQFRVDVDIVDCGDCPVGSVTFQIPRPDLPPGAKILKAILFFGFDYSIDVSSRLEVTPIDPRKPAAPTTGMWYFGFVRGYVNTPSARWPLGPGEYALSGSSSGGEDYTELVRTALATGGQLEPITAEISVEYSLTGSGLAITAGENSVTIETQTLTLDVPSGHAELTVDYEVVPEPSTAGLVVVGVLGLLLSLKWDLTKQTRAT